MDVTNEHELQESLSRSLERTHLLSQVGVLLLDAGVDLERTLFQVVERVAANFASLCFIDLSEGGAALRRVAWAHRERPVDLAMIAEFVPRADSEHPILGVMRSGQPMLIPDVDPDRIDAFSSSSAHATFFRSLEIRSIVAAPVPTRSEVIGVITLSRTVADGRRFDDQDLALVEELGRRIGLAVANARLYQTEREARDLAQRHADQVTSANAELEQFAYIASHDLREPMRMVTQYLDLLQDRLGPKLDEESQGFISRAVEGAQRMQELVRDLLEYTRARRGGSGFGQVDLRQVVDEVLESLASRIAERGAKITTRNLPTAITGHSSRLALLVQNLIDNALTFVPEERSPVIMIKARERPDHWRITVVDNGIGIAPRHQERIFEVFRRLHPRDRYTGTGIGLAICRKIVEQHQGRIWVDSELGAGASFHVTLPKDVDVSPDERLSAQEEDR